jgi:hypothetical protein
MPNRNQVYMQILEHSNDQDLADENVERRDIDAFEEAIGDVSNVTCSSAAWASHGVA